MSELEEHKYLDYSGLQEYDELIKRYFESNIPNGATVTYCICETDGDVANKTVDISDFALETGSLILIKFTTLNTAEDITLNIGGTGAYPVYYEGDDIPADYLLANRLYTMVFNGSEWEVVGHFIDDMIDCGTLSD